MVIQGEVSLVSHKVNLKVTTELQGQEKYYKALKSKDIQPKLLYLAKLLFRIEGHHHQASIPRNVGGTSLRRRRKKKIKNMNNKMVITTYLSTITLNVNGLNARIKR